jgi:branched-chain amino acid transport system substrate-binding protein
MTFHQGALSWLGLGKLLCTILVASLPLLSSAAPKPVLVGLDAELGFKGSTSAEAIRQGMQLAIDDINQRGGVMGGRPLQLVERANNTIPARSIANIREFAQMPDLVAVFCGRFSPTVLESIPVIHSLQVPLLIPWGAANAIVDNGRKPNFVFRLSLRDDWAVYRMMEHLSSRNLQRVGLMMLNTSWGRGTEQSAIEFVRRKGNRLTLVHTEWINWDDTVESIGVKYQRLLSANAQALLLTVNSVEAVLLAKAMLELPPVKRLPVASHWGVAGGNLPAETGPKFSELDFAVVQTFALTGKLTPKQKALFEAHQKSFGSKSPRDIASVVGVGHAYDLMQLLARAIDKAGTTNRESIRQALENLGPYDGVVRTYQRPFTQSRHEALDLKDVFMATYSKSDLKLERMTDIPIAGSR